MCAACCVIEVWCTDPPEVENARIDKNQTTFGDDVTYSCDEGFYLVQGNGKLTCGSKGDWQGDEPRCQGSSSLLVLVKSNVELF